MCVASVALWMRSQYRRDAVVTRWVAHGMAIRSSNGIVRVYLRNADHAESVNGNAWQISSGTGLLLFEDDDPFQGVGWAMSSLSFQSNPTFEWE